MLTPAWRPRRPYKCSETPAWRPSRLHTCGTCSLRRQSRSHISAQAPLGARHDFSLTLFTVMRQGHATGEGGGDAQQGSPVRSAGHEPEPNWSSTTLEQGSQQVSNTQPLVGTGAGQRLTHWYTHALPLAELVLNPHTQLTLLAACPIVPCVEQVSFCLVGGFLLLPRGFSWLLG